RVSRGLTKGAAGFIVSSSERNNSALTDLNVLYSGNTMQLALRILEALRALPEYGSITGVTGSAGKSTVSAMVTHALRSAGQRPVHLPGGNRNIAEQVISTLSRGLRFRHLVVEANGYAFRFFDAWDSPMSPNVSIITNISSAHAAYMGT